jgi:hypothetical protein
LPARSLGQPRQISVDGQWAQRDEHAEDDEEPGSPVGGVVAHDSVRDGDPAADRSPVLELVDQSDRIVGVRNLAGPGGVGEQRVTTDSVGAGPVSGPRTAAGDTYVQSKSSILR